MSTSLLPLIGQIPTPGRLLTVADVAALPSNLPSGSVRYELDNGRLMVMPPAGDIHGQVELRIAVELYQQGERQGHGKARSGEVGIILRRNPDRLVGADALFICNDRLPIRTSPEGYLETIPDLVVEVRSKNDTASEIAAKVADYLAAGTRLVWVLDSQARTITESRPGQSARIINFTETLTAEDIIPGFSVPVAMLLTP